MKASNFRSEKLMAWGHFAPPPPPWTFEGKYARFQHTLYVLAKHRNLSCVLLVDASKYKTFFFNICEENYFAESVKKSQCFAFRNSPFTKQRNQLLSHTKQYFDLTKLFTFISMRSALAHCDNSRFYVNRETVARVHWNN